MNFLQSIVLGVVEGLTEFLPVSSTGHLILAERVLGLEVDNAAVTGFTAVVQFGAVAAVFVFFRRDLVRLISCGLRALTQREARRNADAREAWFVMAGSVPIAIVGLGLKGVVEGPLHSLWVVGVALIVWSPVLVIAERRSRQGRGERSLTLRDALVIGTWQCIALVPGVSRSGATISAALLRNIDRVSATRLSFFLALPALTAATLLELPSALGHGVGLGPTLVGVIVSFCVAYVCIGWLLRFVAGRPITAFVPYRVAAGVFVLVILSVGVL